MIHNLLFIGGAEVVIVLIIALLLFGSKQLPELARGLGKGMKEFKKATGEIQKELNDTDVVSKEVDDIKKNMNS